MSELTEIKVGIVGLLLFFVLYLAFGAWRCTSRWDGSGMTTSWGPIQGCKVQLPDGRWMPEDRVREIDVTGAAK